MDRCLPLDADEEPVAGQESSGEDESSESEEE